MPMRVLAIADVYEALISERPYRPAHTSERALQMIRADVPSRLDADAFHALIALLDESDTGFTRPPSCAHQG
jgi:putative two-component system response regulator